MPKPLFNPTTGQHEDISVINPLPVAGSSPVKDIVLTVDTLAYADGDVLAATQVVTNFFRNVNGTSVLQSIVVIDADDQGIPFDLVFMGANVAMGTENSPPTITDASASNILGQVKIEATDYIDYGGARVASKTGIGLVLNAMSNTSNIAVAAIIRGAATYASGAIRVRCGLRQD